MQMMTSWRAFFTMLLVAFVATSCLSDHCEVYPEHCVVADDGSSGDEETTDADTTDAETTSGGDGACGDGVVEGDEECDDGNQSNNDACTNCVLAVCGDGIVQSENGVEECDAGENNGDDQACTSECLANVCGDGFVGPGEGCDDGGLPDGCTDTCKLPTCGDGVLDPGEVCDDGNTDDADACTSACVEWSCGDGHVYALEEQCDQAELNSDMAMCTAACELAVCGDGLVWLDVEECDEADLNANDAMCTGGCTIAGCGDGLILAGVEECDTGMDNGPNSACTGLCLANVCGDGFVGPGENCDDGNDVDGDDCTNACAPAGCGDAVVGPGEECDDGNQVETDACLSTCVAASCGDGFVSMGQEECDEAELNADNAACTSVCVLAVCGDGLMFVGQEECDQGQSNSDVGMCTAGCMSAVCGDGLVWQGNEVCDEGNDTNDFDGCTTSCTVPQPPVLQLTISPIKRFEFSWAPVIGAEYYQLLESPGIGQNFVQVGGDIMGGATTLTVPLHFRVNARYKLRACDGEGCGESAIVDVVGSLAEAVGYFKASNTGQGDRFGYSVALSGDGNTLAVGANLEESSATGIGGNQADNSLLSAGAVYVFARNGNAWSQQAYVKASNTGKEDNFGYSVALSGDGNTLVVGARNEDSSAIGIGGNQADNVSDAGAVYVFTRNGNAWSQQAYVKASNTGTNDQFGTSVALSGDGNTLAVGAHQEDSSATGIGGNQADNSLLGSGAVYVFARNGNAWSQQAYVKASNTGATDYFGRSVALSEDGNTLAVGAYQEDSSATGIGGNQADNSATDAGAVYVFARNGNAWSQQSYIKASNTGTGDEFGISVALSGDGNTLAVGAHYDTGGAVYVFVRNGNAWSQQAYVKASNSGASDEFGISVALSVDGNTLAVGAHYEDSSATGIGGNQADNSANRGAVYVFTRSGNAWSQQAYVKASNSGANDWFGRSVALSGDGNTLAVGAYQEDSNAAGIGGNQADNSATDAGAVYLY